MSAFTFTAPTFSEDEEALERSTLSGKEKDQIRWDMYGVGASVHDETTTVIDVDDETRGLRLMNEVISTSKGDHDKAALRAAMESVPHLVSRESHFVYFLRCENYNPWAAADRVARYWSIRQHLFGSKAFLPLTMSGAMAGDVEFLRKGFVYLQQRDRRGRPVLFFDRIRCTKETVPRQAAMRCCFYAFSIAATSSYQTIDDSSRTCQPQGEVQRSPSMGGIVMLCNFRVSYLPLFFLGACEFLLASFWVGVLLICLLFCCTTCVYCMLKELRFVSTL
jgi:hypothetical protein